MSDEPLPTESSTPTTTPAFEALQAAMGRITHDVGIVVDREMELYGFATEEASSRPAGEGQVHLSFRLTTEVDGHQGHGTLLLPLPHANGLAASLMMMSDLQVEAARQAAEPDRATKDAMIELGSFIAGAIGDQLAETTTRPVAIAPNGCQGVRADVRPALEYTEGDPLWVVRATCRIADWDEGSWILMLPDLSAAFAS